MDESFVLELPLEVSPSEGRALNIRLEAARHLYNACLSECLDRIALVRQSKEWNKAQSFKKSSENTGVRRELFREAQKKYGFSEYSLHSFVKGLRKNCWIKDHLDSSCSQKLATKAFLAAKEYLLRKRGHPRFKACGRYRSVEGKSNVTGIRFKDGRVIWGIRGRKPLVLTAIFDKKDKHGVQAHALKCPVKYVRLIRKTIRGLHRWYVQLVLAGAALWKKKNVRGQGIVGLDIGPSTIAVVAETTAILSTFCEGLESDQMKIRSLQQKMDRSRRKTNLCNFELDGTIKKGPKRWFFSNRYKMLADKVSERQRCLASTRKRMHGDFANLVIGLGVIIKTEDLSYKSFQKKYGKSVNFRAPGLFLSLLRRKAESAGGKVEEFSTYETRLSQTCHCGFTKKKTLSERWHNCDCGVIAQRDLFSAHLARFVKNNKLDTYQAQQAWSAAEPLLERAVLSLEQRAKGESRLSSFGLGQRQSPSHAKEGSLFNEAVDVVGVC